MPWEKIFSLPHTLLLAEIIAMMTGLWLFSLVWKDASIVDRFWGMGFVLVAWTSFLWQGTYSQKSLVLCLLVSLWGLRLSLYITWRNWGKGEDFRYQKWRNERGKNFPLFSFFQVFLLQGLLLYVISLPLPMAILGSSSFSWMDGIAFFIWISGFLFESLADFQMARFKRNPENRGKVCDRGLWRYSRHPNYFGDALVFWGFWGFALSAEGGGFTFFSPLLMNFLLLKVSGVPLLEKSLGASRPGYSDYIQRTNSFVPWFPEKTEK